MRMLVVVVSLLCLAGVSAKKGSFPKELERCRKDDPKINECLKSAIQKALPVLAKGIPSAALLPIDPMHTPRINLQQYYGPVTINLTFIDLYARGYSNMTITRVRANIPNHNLRISASFPRVIVDGTYDVLANVFLLPVEGRGTFAITMDEVEATVDVKGEGELRGGSEYMRIKNLPVTFEPKKLHFDLKNLFNGDERLGNYTNRFLNRHSRAVYRATQRLCEETASKFYTQFAQSFFDLVPYDEIFP